MTRYCSSAKLGKTTVREPEEDYDSLSDSDTEMDPRIPYRDEYSLPQEVHQETIAEKQKSDPLLSKIRQWVKNEHKPTAQEYKLLTPDEKFYVDCFEYLQLNSDDLLIRLPIPYTNEKDSRIALPETPPRKRACFLTWQKSLRRKFFGRCCSA